MKASTYQSSQAQKAAQTRIDRIFSSIKGREIAPWDRDRLILEAEVLKPIAVGRVDRYIVKAQSRLEKNNFETNPAFRHTVAAELELLQAIQGGPAALGALATKDASDAIFVGRAVPAVAASILGVLTGKAG